jgi:hypothetical protein
MYCFLGYSDTKFYQEAQEENQFDQFNIGVETNNMN